MVVISMILGLASMGMLVVATVAGIGRLVTPGLLLGVISFGLFFVGTMGS